MLSAASLLPALKSSSFSLYQILQWQKQNPRNGGGWNIVTDEAHSSLFRSVQSFSVFSPWRSDLSDSQASLRFLRSSQSRSLWFEPSLRTLHRNKVAMGGIVRLATSNAYCTGFCRSPVVPLVIHRPPSLLVLATQLSPSDAPQRSEEWFALRKDKLTTSTFSTALGFWKGTRRPELWQEKVFESEKHIVEASKRAMEWGVLNEEVAIEKYKSITGREVSSYGFATHAEERYGWIGASPDGLLEGLIDCYQGGGILEVKCPYNKGKPEKALPWSTMPFYYMPQVQGQMEVLDREWVDLYCWTPNGSTIFRMCRDRSYWNFMHGILREFWWENVVPAREALLMGKEEDAKQYIPTSTHKQTGLAIVKSLKLASESKLLCRQIAGHVEFL